MRTSNGKGFFASCSQALLGNTRLQAPLAQSKVTALARSRASVLAFPSGAWERAVFTRRMSIALYLISRIRHRHDSHAIDRHDHLVVVVDALPHEFAMPL